MRWVFALAAVVGTTVAGTLLPAHVRAHSASRLGGVWALNRSASDLPKDIGFNPSWMTNATAEGRGSSGGGRGRRGSTGGGDRSGAAGPYGGGRQESYEDAQRVQFLTGEARNPPARLILVDTPAAVTMTNELGQSRTLHPDGKEESIDLQGVSFRVTSRRDGDQLTVDYRVDQDREVRYTYSSEANPTRLIVDVQFLQHGAGDKAKFVYEPGIATETLAPTGPSRTAPSPGQSKPEAFDQRPGAELRGLTSLGILVENLSAQAAACGLNQDTIEGALSKRLTNGGLSVRRNSDEDTYVYVNIQTTNLPGGMCVSRYDAFLYTHATAKLSYRDQAVLVQVSLMHRGGIDIGSPSGHGPALIRGLENYIDLFVTQIHDANK